MHRHASNKMRLLTSTTLAGVLTAVLVVPALAQESVPQEQGFFTMLGRLVFGAGSERVAIDVPQAVTVLNQDDIEGAENGTIGDILKRIPGVTTVGSESRFGESINIRGIGTGTSADEPRIVMVIDGVPKYYEQYRMGSLFTDPGFFKSVEVLRGPSSSTLYGSGAIAGVVAMETKDASDFLEDGDGFAVRQRFQYGTNGDKRDSSTFVAYAPDERLELLFGAFRNDTHASEDGAGGSLPGTAVQERNYMLKGSYRFGTDLAHTIETAYIYYDGFADDQYYDVIDNSAFWGTLDRQVEDTTAYVQYNFNPAGNNLVDLDVQLSYSESFVGMTDVNLHPVLLPQYDVDYAYEGYGLKVENRAEWEGAGFENYLTAGLSYTTQDRVTERAAAGIAEFHPAGQTDTLSIYAQNETVFNERLTVIAGLRADRQEFDPDPIVTNQLHVNNTSYAATLAAHYKVNENFAVFGSASYTERAPVIDEIYDTRPTSGGANMAALGSLQQERSRNFEIGASWTMDGALIADDQLAFKGVVFRNNMSNQISRNNAGVAGDPTYVNITKSYIRGVELEGSWESENWFGRLAYTHLEGKNHSATTTDPTMQTTLPADQLALGLGWKLPDQGLRIGWDLIAAASDTGRDGTKSSGYAIHDAYVDWEPQQGALEGIGIRFGVTNLFDREYRTDLQRDPVRNEGRSFNLSLTKTF